MKTIYLVGRSPYNEDYLLNYGYASNFQEIKEIISKYSLELFGESDIVTKTEMNGNNIILYTESSEGDKTTYYAVAVDPLSK